MRRTKRAEEILGRCMVILRKPWKSGQALVIIGNSRRGKRAEEFLLVFTIFRKKKSRGIGARSAPRTDFDIKYLQTFPKQLQHNMKTM